MPARSTPAANNSGLSRPPVGLAAALAIGLTLVLFPGDGQAEVDIELSSSTEISTTGAFQLSWATDSPNTLTFELVKTRLGAESTAQTTAAGDEAVRSRTVYTGADTARFESGLPDGAYRYQIRALDADAHVVGASEPVVVNVSHHPLARALGFFALGALVFAAISAWVFRADTRTRCAQP